MARLSDVELVVARSVEIERLLEQRYGARGHGLGTKVRSCSRRLPRPLVRKVLRLATQRNRVIHEGTGLEDRKAFCDLAASVRRELKNAGSGRRAPKSQPRRPGKAKVRAQGGRRSWAIGLVLVGVVVASLLLVPTRPIEDGVRWLRGWVERLQP